MIKHIRSYICTRNYAEIYNYYIAYIELVENK